MFYLIVGLLLFFVGQKGQFCPSYRLVVPSVCCLWFSLFSSFFLFVCLFAACCFLVMLVCFLVYFHHGLSHPIQSLHFLHLNAKPQGRGAFKDHRLGQKKPEESIRKTHAVQVPWGFGKPTRRGVGPYESYPR